VFHGSYSEFIINIMQDASSNLPCALTPQAKASDETTLRDRVTIRVDSPWKVGAHVSSAGGVENAVTNAVAIGSVKQIWPSHQTYYVSRANSFALFLKSRLKWKSPPLTPESVSEFRKRMKQHGYASNMVLPHGIYLINLGNPDKFVQT
jgi:AP endonuclease 1